MNRHFLSRPARSEERAIALIQEILGVSREEAEHAYMLIEAHLRSEERQYA